MSKKITILLIILTLLISLLAFLPLGKVEASAKGTEWMKELPDNTPLREMSIPGTHDSGALHSIGDVAGKEVVQLYVQPTESIVSRPYKELKKFTKVEMAPGEKKRIRFVLNNSDFVYYNSCLRKWHLESGGYNILIGASSQDIRLGKGVVLENPDDYTINRVGKCMVL